MLQAKDRGEEVNEWFDQPEVAFSGDSTIELIDREESMRKARLLIMELTFLDDRVSVAAARSKGHIHLDEVLERAELFENQTILFTHVSARWRRRSPQNLRRSDARLSQERSTYCHPCAAESSRLMTH